MKKLVVAIVILAVIVTCGILESVFIHKIFTELDERLYTLEGMLIDEDEASLANLEEMTSWWEKKRRNVELFAYSPDIRAFSVALGEAEGSLKCGDYANALSKCQSLIVMSDNIHSILDFNFEDII